MYTVTTATNKILALTKRIRAVCGGTSAGKTISILSILIDKAQRDKVPTLTSVVSETVPHLKKGAIKDFLSIMQKQGYYKEDRWNRSDFTYTFETGSKIEFFSGDQPHKARGPRRDRLFLNECNNIAFEIFDQMEVRTTEVIYLDWNPVTTFWFYEAEEEGEQAVIDRDDVDFITLTYKDNESLDDRIVRSIEQRKSRKSWWRVYGEGKLGQVEGRIYKDWKLIDEVPHEARLERRGLDFGYSNHPTAIVDIYYYNGGFILDLICYRKGMSNRTIADLLIATEKPDILTIADSAEPKSIDELQDYGISIQPAVKGQGSVSNGITFVQDQKISVTKRSTKLIKEYRGYLWDKNKDGKFINVPVKINDHAMDAVRYALSPLMGDMEELEEEEVGLYSQEYD